MRKLAARFSLPLDDLLGAQPNGSAETYLFDGQYYPKAQADADFLDIADIVGADLERRRLSDDVRLVHARRASRSIRLSVHDWIESRVPGGHASPLGQLLDVAYNDRVRRRDARSSRR